MNQEATIPAEGARELENILAGAQKVFDELGCGFLEAVYQEALSIELSLREVPFHQQSRVPVFYGGRQLNAYYQCDFFCYGRVIVELKAISTLTGREDAQVINYLKAAQIPLGIILNFGSGNLQYKHFYYPEAPFAPKEIPVVDANQPSLHESPKAVVPPPPPGIQLRKSSYFC